MKIADIVIRGEGEDSIIKVVKALESKANLRNIPGVSFRWDGTIYNNNEQQSFVNLNRLPYPAWHLFNLQFYKRFPMALMRGAIIPIQASRGCPYRCNFCSQDKMITRVRYREMLGVVEEIEYMYKKYKCANFRFYDAYFPFSNESAEEFCCLMVKKKLHKKIKWVSEARVDFVNYDLLVTMKNVGMHLIMYGFEVGNQRILDSIGKKTTVEQARLAMTVTKKAGIKTTGYFMLGMPGENENTCKETIRFAKKLNPDVAKFNIFVPLPGSHFYDQHKKKLRIVSLNQFTAWPEKFESTVPLNNGLRDVSEKKLMYLQRKAMVTFYLQPRKIREYCLHFLHRRLTCDELFWGMYIIISNYLKVLINRVKDNGHLK